LGLESFKGKPLEAPASIEAPLPSDVQKRINAAIKIFDEAFNRQYIGELPDFETFSTNLRWAHSSLMFWICVQELLTQKDHLSYAWMIDSWMEHMIIKWFTYRQGVGLDKARWPDTKAIAMTYLKFKNRATKHHFKAVKEAFKPAKNWNMPYWVYLEKIWSIDPDAAQNVWKEIFPDPVEVNAVA